MSDDPFIAKTVALRTDYGRFVIGLTADMMEAYLSCGEPSGHPTRESLVELLSESDLTYGLVDEGLDEVLRLTAEELSFDKVLIAEGTPPTPGRDAEMIFEKNPVGHRKKVDETASINYRELHTFDNVKVGDHLATYVPAEPGTGGADVKGRSIPASPVEDLKLRVGEGARYDEEVHQVFATANGCVFYEKQEISVSTEYRVDGDLDLKHGNINFIGSVHVAGDVPDEYELTAGSLIEIGGTAESCKLESGGDVVVGGGVTGKGTGTIKAKGEVRARYLNETVVVADGDVIVEREIVNSRVYTEGRVIVRAGSIMGGEVVALKGILLKDAGSELGVKTTLAAGIHYSVYKQLRGVSLELVELQEDQQKRLNALAAWLSQALEGETVEDLRKTKIEENMARVRDQAVQVKRLEEKSGDLSRKYARVAVKCISIERNLFASVVAVVGRFERKSTDAVKGPLSLSEDPLQWKVGIEQGLRIEELWNQQESLPVDEEDTLSRPASGAEHDYSLPEVEELYTRYAPEGVEAEGKRILVAEDQLNMRKLIMGSLTRKGYCAIGAKDGLEALQTIRSEKLDCVILDINMPKIDGLSILKAIRADAKYAHLPVLVCSGNRSPQDVVKAHKLGATGYMIKPPKMEKLIETVDSYFQQSPPDADQDKDQ